MIGVKRKTMIFDRVKPELIIPAQMAGTCPQIRSSMLNTRTGTQNDATDAFNSDLMWPAVGARFANSGNLSSAKAGIHFDVWSSCAGTGNTALFLTTLNSSGANIFQTGRATGKSVRCIRTVE